jgi:hypothetical protein
MNYTYMLCARDVKGGKFIPEPGPSLYLKVPKGELPKPGHAISEGRWSKELRAAATWGRDGRRDNQARGDLLIFVHGYNNDLRIIRDRHEQLERDLMAIGFKGAVMTFCWPSDDSALNYLEDRHDAKTSAMQLVSDGIRILSEQQTPDCTVNIHLLGHSTGAYVIREAFDDADDTALPNSGWSMSDGNSSTDSLYRHCYRLTNYHSKHDSALKLSNAKRAGIAPRVGRVGMPEDAPGKSVDVDCSEYFGQLCEDEAMQAEDQLAKYGSFDHSWHIGNKVFTADLFETLKGDLDRGVIPTRRAEADGRLVLVRG